MEALVESVKSRLIQANWLLWNFSWKKSESILKTLVMVFCFRCVAKILEVEHKLARRAIVFDVPPDGLRRSARKNSP